MRHKSGRIAALLLALLLAAGCQSSGGTGVDSSAARDGMKAVWVATVYGLDYPSQPTANADALRREADEILNRCAEMGMNTVIFQVRPTADAFYPSTLFPWSRYLTGSQHTAPSGGFDPLAYWVERAHALGLELHAWINPYRITKNGQTDLDALAADSPARLHPEWVVEYDGNYYFDPALPEVRELVIQGVEELCRNYQIDGIHLDDYFYPGAGFSDGESYARYGGSFSDRDDWRRENVNQLVKDLGERIHAIKPELSYGISPSGVWADSWHLSGGSATTGAYESYFSAYADSRKWVKEGWIDYICPQVYWYIGHPSMDYETIVNWWARTVSGTGVKLYVGMADYQAGSADPLSPWHGTAAIQAQLALNDSIPEIAGEVHFRYRLMVEQADLYALYQSRAAGSGAAVQPTPTPPPASPSTLSTRPRLDGRGTSYIQGADGQFFPDRTLTRAEAVTMLARLAVDAQGQPLYTAQTEISGFADVNAGQWYAPYIAFAARYGIVNGYPDGNFYPERNISRAELVRLICSFFDGVPDAGNTDAFSDLPAGHWASGALSYAHTQGWLHGYPDGTVQPDRAITRAEAVTLLNAALDRASVTGGSSPFTDVPPGHWAFDAILAAAGVAA